MPFSRTIIGTYLIILVNVIVYIKTQENPYLIDKYGLYPDKVLRDKEYYRLITSTFMHLNIYHIMLNMYSFYSVGRTLEFLLGTPKFLALYLLMGVLTGLVASFARRIFHSSDTISVGASGVMFALFGIFIGSMIRTAGVVTAFKSSLNSLIPIIILSLIPGIDKYGHFAGLLVGIITGLFL